MALLRNLCNLLRVGISARHHELVLQRLQHEVCGGGRGTRGGCSDAAASSSWLWKVLATSYFMWAINRYGDMDRLAETDLLSLLAETVQV